MLKTIEFIKTHKDWKELLSVAPYCLTIKEDEHYYLLQYSQIESDFNEEICRECRGLIIDKTTLDPEALSFFKFFNYGEQYAADIDWSTAKVQEKVDGSKILMFYDEYTNDWRVCTSSTLNAYDCPVGGWDFSFGQLFEKALANNYLTLDRFKLILIPEYCYTFELVSPENRVVVPYKKADLYFTGIRSRFTWEEEDPDGFPLLCEHIKRPKSYSLSSLEDCLAATEKMGFDEEGFVAVDASWNRVKIKSPSYVAAHYIKNNGVQTPYRALGIILQNEDEEFLTYYPEYTELIEGVRVNLNSWLKRCKEAVIDIDKHILASQKDLATYVMKNHKDISDVLFNYRKKAISYSALDNWLMGYFQGLTKDRKISIITKGKN